MDGHVKTTKLIGLLVVLAIVAALLLALSNIAKQQRFLAITSYQECAHAGYPIQETYPSRCVLPDGRSFVNPDETAPIQSPTETSTTTPTDSQFIGEGCAVAGCSGQLCLSVDQAQDIVTTCEYRAEYACYKSARCEMQTNGKCGWTQTPALKQCLQNPPQLE